MVAQNPLIIGCGYLGLALALRLKAQGISPTGWVRSPEAAEKIRRQHAVDVRAGDVSDPASWKQFPGDHDWVIHCASSGKGGVEAYRHVYLEGARQILRQRPNARFFFISSTSVYGQTDGSWVEEGSPAEPAVETGKILREAEDLVLARGGTILRVAGIYGPGRGVLFRKFCAGEAVIEGDGQRWINQVHRDDAVQAVAVVGEQAASAGIWNVADNEPVRLLDYYMWLAGRLQKPLPPRGTAPVERKRGGTSKRVANAKLRRAGWTALYPSFREGLAEEVAEAVKES
jgi:nucleoside-diphosphate-sugar epimerase